jgi:hypothetical protein
MWGFDVLGTGRGHLTANTDWRKLCIQLAKVASDHGANAINYQIFNHGTELRVQFLRIRDDLLQKVRAPITKPRKTHRQSCPRAERDLYD